MARFLCGVAVIGAMLLSCSATFAEKDVDSANYMMAGRRSFIVKPPDNDYFLNGRCAGIVETLIESGLGVCAPASSTSGQAIRVVVKYIDDRPARMHENFKPLALEALREAWPCKK